MRNPWITIPGGSVLLEPGDPFVEATAVEVDPFAITTYPITNAQFAAFIEAGGYDNREWWLDAGWMLRQRERWIETRFWDDCTWSRPDCPVVGVSWYEALAFCRWWSADSGHTITLPSEQQWQRAAQGDDAREFPWGSDDPDARRCNWNRDIDATTPVTGYPEGASPYGVMDMSGNVWEWCLSGDPSARLLRGGSWSSDSPLSLRAAHRTPLDPNTRLHPGYRNHATVGFRCVQF